MNKEIHRHFCEPEKLKEILEQESRIGFLPLENPGKRCGHCGMLEIIFTKKYEPTT